MRIQVSLAVWGFLALVFATPSIQAQDKTLLDRVAAAMNADNVKTVRILGSGSVYLMNKTAKAIHAHLTSYAHELDLDASSSRVVMTYVPAGATGEQTQTIVSSGTGSWETQHESVGVPLRECLESRMPRLYNGQSTGQTRLAGDRKRLGATRLLEEELSAFSPVRGLGASGHHLVLS